MTIYIFEGQTGINTKLKKMPTHGGKGKAQNSMYIVLLSSFFC